MNKTVPIQKIQKVVEETHADFHKHATTDGIVADFYKGKLASVNLAISILRQWLRPKIMIVQAQVVQVFDDIPSAIMWRITTLLKNMERHNQTVMKPESPMYAYLRGQIAGLQRIVGLLTERELHVN